MLPVSHLLSPSHLELQEHNLVSKKVVKGRKGRVMDERKRDREKKWEDEYVTEDEKSESEVWSVEIRWRRTRFEGISWPVVFDDCAGNEGVEFEVSNPNFLIDENLNLVPRKDVIDSGDVMFVHGVNVHVDEMAQVTIMGAPSRSPQTLREILGLSDIMPYRSKRSLLVPPMFVPENQRAPFPRSIGKINIAAVCAAYSRMKTSSIATTHKTFVKEFFTRPKAVWEENRHDSETRERRTEPDGLLWRGTAVNRRHCSLFGCLLAENGQKSYFTDDLRWDSINV
ncbi:Cadherin-13 [Anabarilius grahami]|uniref:Cadherin-13 n=1 Tax=Anabarilius grahami TaxID=495550 RepID=A0A3N0YC47_ANAGA|nr:Cadherin-13 [Anabarilius grahami]